MTEKICIYTIFRSKMTILESLARVNSIFVLTSYECFLSFFETIPPPLAGEGKRARASAIFHPDRSFPRRSYRNDRDRRLNQFFDAAHISLRWFG